MSIRIGFLAPYSSIYQGMSDDMVGGFYAALPDHLLQSRFFEFVPEYIRQGGSKDITAAVRKLVHFNNVDILSGLMSYKSLPDIIPIIEGRKKLGFFMDMGENIPYNHHISDYVFFNSFQFWQSEYALGHWAFKEFGDKGTVLMSLYDAGYHLQSAFRQGAVVAGSQEMDYAVLHGDPAKSQVKENVRQFFRETYTRFPSFLHGIFCGDESVEFLREFAGSELNGKVPLIITSHMASEEMLDKIGDISIDMYAASMYSYHSEDKLNKDFKTSFERYTGRKANTFALLGYEIGKMLLEMVPYLEKRDFNTVARLLKNSTVKSPRGERSFYLDSQYALPVIDIEKIRVRNGKIDKVIVGQGRSMKYNSFIFDEIHRENVSGWQNPYLCV